MKGKDILRLEKREKDELVPNKSKTRLINIKSDFFLKILFDIVLEKRRLEIIKNNKNIQNRLYININDYKKFCEAYSSIEIEIIPSKIKYGKFINIVSVEEPEDRKYYHIFFNDNKKEIQNYFLNGNDNVSKINIRIDYQIKSFKKLFMRCSLIEYICFKKFHRKKH